MKQLSLRYFKRNEQKVYFYCDSSRVKKNGKRKGVQFYKCRDCGKQFRGVKRLDIAQLSDDYVFGWRFGVVVFKDARTSKILWRKFVFKRETLADYQEGVDWLLSNGFCIEGVFEEWTVKWGDFLKERTQNQQNRQTHYTHSKLRSAYLSIKRNMPYPWVWSDNPASAGIPNHFFKNGN